MSYVLKVLEEYFQLTYMFLILSNKVKNYLRIQIVHVSVCARSIFFKFSLSVLKLVHVIQVYYRMLRIETMHIGLKVRIQRCKKNSNSLYHWAKVFKGAF